MIHVGMGSQDRVKSRRPIGGQGMGHDVPTGIKAGRQGASSIQKHAPDAGARGVFESQRLPLSDIKHPQRNAFFPEGAPCFGASLP